MRNKLLHCCIVTLLIFLLSGIFIFKGEVKADTVEDLQKQIDELTHLRKLSEEATGDLEVNSQELGAKISSIQNQINQKGEEIERREEEVDKNIDLMNLRIRAHYKRMRQESGMEVMLSAGGATDWLREVQMAESAASRDRDFIVKTTGEILGLEEESKQLAVLQVSLDREKGFLDEEIGKAKDYQSELSGQIASLSARQQAILAEKTGTFQTSVGEVPLADDPNSRPDFDPGFSPAFAAFSFGAPHYKGMSQYGAYGRAKSGQSAEEILKAYYGSGIEIKKDYSTDITIQVDGYGGYNIEEYVKRIYEMPASWTDNDLAALKAQAVAARSYALARTNNGAGSICATEACQVFKSAPKGGAWETAVNATRGWVLIANGQPFSAWYASTSGGYQESYSSNGYSTPGFWDAEGGKGGWTGQAWEVRGGSPWFYKAWYKSRSGDACGLSHPWLTEAEMADVLNAWVVLQQGSDDRVSPIGPCWGGDPYSIDELKGKGGFTSVSSVSVTYAENGMTSSVTFGTNKGPVTIGGLDFKKVFNLRAPGRIALKSGLFNIEKK